MTVLWQPTQSLSLALTRELRRNFSTSPRNPQKMSPSFTSHHSTDRWGSWSMREQAMKGKLSSNYWPWISPSKCNFSRVNQQTSFYVKSFGFALSLLCRKSTVTNKTLCWKENLSAPASNTLFKHTTVAQEMFYIRNSKQISDNSEIINVTPQ